MTAVEIPPDEVELLAASAADEAISSFYPA